MLSSLNQSFGYDVFLHREVKPIYCYMHLFIMSKAYLLEGSIVSTVEENWMLLINVNVNETWEKPKVIGY